MNKTFIFSDNDPIDLQFSFKRKMKVLDFRLILIQFYPKTINWVN